MPLRLRAVLALCALLPLVRIPAFAQGPAPASSAVAPVPKGPGVVMPRLRKETTPSYTPEAMQMKLEGSISLEAVVRADGTVGSVQAVRCDVKSVRSVEAVGFHVKSSLLNPASAEGAQVRGGVVKSKPVPRPCAETAGLAEAAVKAAKQWEFTPGTKDGVAVPVLVEIEMTFTLR